MTVTNSTGIIRELHGLERVCRALGRIKTGSTMMVWDYVAEKAVPESEMPMGSVRWKASDKKFWSEIKT